MSLRIVALVLTAGVLCGCPPFPDRPADSAADPHHDWDGDGYCEESPCAGDLPDGDCDDGDAAIHPGAEEACDGQDSDCDGALGSQEVDADGDGFLACEECDDTNAALEIADADGDGHTTCDGDCDDGDAVAYPGADEVCNGVDDDCDGAVPADEEDGDGDGYAGCDGDCDEGDAAVNPGAEEVCNGVDDDCDPTTDKDVDPDGDGVSACDGLDNDCDGVDDDDCVTCVRWVPTDEATIQAALDESSSGDVICVAPGTYYENLLFGGVDVQLLGVGGATATVIDGQASGSVVTLDSGEGLDTLVAGFTLTGGNADQGGGLRIEQSSPTLRDLIVIANEATENGGGIYLSESAAEVTDTLVDANTAGGGGGGIYATDTSVPTFEYLWVSGNQAEAGGGMRLVSDVDAVVANAVVEANVSSEKGGGISLHASSIVMTQARIAGNDAGAAGGGLRLRSNSEGTLTNVIVAGNAAGDDGGGIHLIGYATLAMENVSIVGNETTSSGGGLCVNTTSSVEYLNVDISENSAASGGGVFVEAGGAADITRSNAFGNTPDAFSGISDPVTTFGNIAEDPQYLDVASATPLLWDLHLGASSALMGAGSNDIDNPDGERSDIGAYGGPGTAEWDLDHDGFPEWWQAGPYDPATYPGEGWDCADQDPWTHADQGC